MKAITIFALGHRVVKINKDALKMDVIKPTSAYSIGSVAHGGCSLLVDKVQDKKLKRELKNLQIHLKKQNDFGTILACINKVQR